MNLEDFNLMELSEQEAIEAEGGIFAAFGAVAAACTIVWFAGEFAYQVGKHW